MLGSCKYCGCVPINIFSCFFRNKEVILPNSQKTAQICHSLSYPKQAEAGAFPGSRFCFCAEDNKKPPHPALCTRVRRFGGICPE